MVIAVPDESGAMYIHRVGKSKFSMPLGQKLLGGLGLPAVIFLIGFGSYLHGPKHELAAPIAAGLLALGAVVLFFGRTVVLKPEGIAYGHLFIPGRPIPWTHVNDVTTSSKLGYRGVGRGSWHVELHFQGGGALRLPVPYGVGAKPGDAFCADYEALRQRWRQERTHAKLVDRKPSGKHDSSRR